MQFKNSFQVYQALLIFLLTSFWVILVAGAIEYFQWHTVVVTSLLIHGGIIVITFACTAVIIKSINISALFKSLSFTRTVWRYYLIAIALAVVIWLADFWLQLFLFLDDGKSDSLDLQTEMKYFGIFNIVLASCLFAPIAEEILFRSILLKGLLSKLNPLAAILITSLLFAAIHFSPQDFISLFVAATGYAVLTIKSQSILPAVLAHMINNSITVYYLSSL